MMILFTAGLGFLYFTGPGSDIRMFLAETVITTQHRQWAWLLVGTAKRDEMIQTLLTDNDTKAKDPLNTSLIKLGKRHAGELVKVEDISGKMWQGKMMTVFDPKSIRVVVPAKQGEGEKITDMVKRTGAVAGLNAGASMILKAWATGSHRSGL